MLVSRVCAYLSAVPHVVAREIGKERYDSSLERAPTEIFETNTPALHQGWHHRLREMQGVKRPTKEAESNSCGCIVRAR